jgi:hypothetical protein
VPDIGPHDPPPVRLTFAPLQDLTPAWLPDQSGLVYSYERPDSSPDGDRCLGILPPDGGTRRLSKCFPTDLAHDSAEALGEPALSPGGRLAWVEAHSERDGLVPDNTTIRIGTLQRGDTGVIVRSFPYQSPSGAVHLTATHLGWLGEDTLLYVGSDVFYGAACQGCKTDTIVVGREIVQLDLTVTPPQLSIVPNSATATGVWPAADGSAIYYTLGGDGRVFHRALATGAVTTLFDFTSLGIARDPSAVGSSLVAVVGGRVTFNPASPLYGPFQSDSGGFLYHVDLGTGAVSPLGLPGLLLRRPALSPSGDRIAAEAYPLAPYIANIYLFQTP